MPSIKEILVAPSARTLAIPAIILTIQLYFVVNGQLLFSNTWGTWQDITFIYIFFVLAAVVLARETFTTPPAYYTVGWFLVTFFVGTLLFEGVFRLFGGSLGRTYLPVPIGDKLPTILFQAFVITYSEETFFRGFMAEKTGIIPSSIAFAVFHFAAYTSQGFSLFQLIQPLAAGLIFGIIYYQTKSRAGIGVTWGIHLAFNLAVLGISLLPF